MQYMLLLYADESRAPEEAVIQSMMGQFNAYTDAHKKAGAFIAGDRLHRTSMATAVRNPDGKVKVLNGPYAETREQLGGYYLIDVSDIDAAISWAGRCPGAVYGTVEVRPVFTAAMADA